MMRFRDVPPAEELRDKLSYDPETGIFIWKNKNVRKKTADDQAGTIRKDGRRFISLGGVAKQIGAHRVAWVYMHGGIPEGMEVDHIDCDPSNNRISNLRLATSSQQKMNKRVQSNNRSGLKGAFYHACRKGKKWRSQIKTAEKKLVFLGYFDTALEAHEAYAQACIHYHGEFARTA